MAKKSKSTSASVREITFPEASRLLPHQNEILMNDDHRFKVLIWHRRARKTTTAIIGLVRQAHLRPGPYWHVFPTYAEAKNAIWRDPNMIFDIIPECLIDKRNEAELVIYFKNGAYLQLMGSENVDRLRGTGPFGFVLDEYDSMREEVWPVLQPIVRANYGWAWFIGTPKGRQKLYDLYNLGQSDDPEWKSWILKASESNVIASEELANAKKTMSSGLYNQEFECDFIEGQGSIFRGVRDICTATPTPPVPNRLYVMGVDLAKVQDYTTMVVYDRSTNSQVYQDRIQTLEWPYQKKKIAEVAVHFNNATVVLDATGLGDPIADDLIRAGLAIIPFKITGENKKDMIEKLSIFIEQQKITMLNLPETLLEFDNYSYELLKSGRIIYNAREGYHDDIVMAHALAITELGEIYKEPLIEEMPRIRKAYLERSNTYNPEPDTDWEAI